MLLINFIILILTILAFSVLNLLKHNRFFFNIFNLANLINFNNIFIYIRFSNFFIFTNVINFFQLVFFYFTIVNSNFIILRLYNLLIIESQIT